MHTHGDSNTRVHLYHEMLIRESANISLNIATVAQQRQTDTTETDKDNINNSRNQQPLNPESIVFATRLSQRINTPTVIHYVNFDLIVPCIQIAIVMRLGLIETIRQRKTSCAVPLLTHTGVFVIQVIIQTNFGLIQSAVR